MTTLDEYRRYGDQLESGLRLKTSPIAIRMLREEKDIPEGAIRPKQDRGYHLAQCQVFTMSRRQGMTIAMLKEDNWCWAPLLAYGLVEDPKDSFVNAHTSFPRFEYGKYIGIVTAPLRSTSFEPDMVMVYSNTGQLRDMISVAKNLEKTTIKSEFDPIDSLPDPGERARAFAEDDEIIFSVPAEKLAGLAEGVKRSIEMKQNPDDWSHLLLRPDFPRPSFYTDLFRKWGLDVEK
jgi:uncharacterized protein (DUF169 family)